MVRGLPQHHAVAAIEPGLFQLEQLAADQQLFAAIDHLAPLQGQGHVHQYLASGAPFTPASLIRERRNGDIPPGSIPKLHPVVVAKQIAARQHHGDGQPDDTLHSTHAQHSLVSPRQG
ncbi:hypothetical protein D3C72_1903960 [compost metagenome]